MWSSASVLGSSWEVYWTAEMSGKVFFEDEVVD